MAQGQLAKFQAGLENQQQQFGNTLAGRQSYFSGGPRIAAEQNSADVSRGLGVSQIQTGQARDQNSYNLSANQGQNSFALDSFANAMKAYDQARQLAASRSQGLLSLGSGLGGLVGKGLGMLMPGAGGAGAAIGGAVGNAFTKPSLGAGGWLLGNGSFA